MTTGQPEVSVGRSVMDIAASRRFGPVVVILAVLMAVGRLASDTNDLLPVGLVFWLSVMAYLQCVYLAVPFGRETLPPLADLRHVLSRSRTLSLMRKNAPSHPRGATSLGAVWMPMVGLLLLVVADIGVHAAFGFGSSSVRRAAVAQLLSGAGGMGLTLLAVELVLAVAEVFGLLLTANLAAHLALSMGGIERAHDSV